MVILISFIISLVLFYLYIKFFSFVKQTEREEGISTHKKKNGTITMGGIVLFLVVSILFLLFNDSYNLKMLFLLLPSVFFFIVGFIDDLLIVRFHKNDGLNSNLRLLLEIIFSALFYGLYIKLFNDNSLDLFGYKIDLGFLYGILIVLMLVGSTNACNLTDGIDGLMGGIYVITLIFFLIIALFNKEDMIGLFIMINIGATLGFLYFNLPRAKLFMGDCGSLMMGANLCCISILLHIEAYLPLFLIVPVIETLSVILQVSYFKLSKGKRLFKMTPFHHHLEMCGFSETKLIIIFYAITIIFGLLALFLIKYIGL